MASRNQDEGERRQESEGSEGQSRIRFPDLQHGKDNGTLGQQGKACGQKRVRAVHGRCPDRSEQKHIPQTECLFPANHLRTESG